MTMTTFPKRIAPPIVLAIAGSEASGGAGAQTDLKTFHQLGVFGCTALTCIVSMDPKAGFEHRFVPVDPEVIHDQIEACASVHAAIDAVKIGMLGTAAAIDVVDAALEEYAFPDVVLDPVLICKGQEFGGALEVDNALRTKILPRATMTTPNLFEAATLAGMEEITTVEQLKDAAKRTAGMVGYVGEWHSHPPGHSASPSRHDLAQLVHLALGMADDGLPAVQLIVGEQDLQILQGAVQ